MVKIHFRLNTRWRTAPKLLSGRNFSTAEVGSWQKLKYWLTHFVHLASANSILHDVKKRENWSSFSTTFMKHSLRAPVIVLCGPQIWISSFYSAPKKGTTKRICSIINTSAMRCQIVLKFGMLVHYVSARLRNVHFVCRCTTWTS